MKREEVKAAVLRIEGTNCEEEMAQSFRRLSAQAEIVHLKQFTSQVRDQWKRRLVDYHVLMFPGGFSAGDYVRAGAIFAARLKSKLSGPIKDFVAQGYPIGGVCNGFQILVEMGLLPAIGKHSPEAVLTTNESDRFECRPTYLKMVNRGTCKFTRGIGEGELVYAPSAHAEGKYLMHVKDWESKINKLEDNDMVVFKYVDPEGEEASYPWNPNGTPGNVAGICNLEGNVFGMMPHPERSFFEYQHPEWAARKARKETSPYDKYDGARIFSSVIDYVCRNF